MNQQYFSPVVETGIQMAMIQNETLDRDLILQYYTEEQLELLARLQLPEWMFEDLTIEQVNWEGFIEQMKATQETNLSDPYSEEIQELCRNTDTCLIA